MSSWCYPLLELTWTWYLSVVMDSVAGPSSFCMVLFFVKWSLLDLFPSVFLRPKFVCCQSWKLVLVHWRFNSWLGNQSLWRNISISPPKWHLSGVPSLSVAFVSMLSLSFPFFNSWSTPLLVSVNQLFIFWPGTSLMTAKWFSVPSLCHQFQTDATTSHWTQCGACLLCWFVQFFMYFALFKGRYSSSWFNHTLVPKWT